MPIIEYDVYKQKLTALGPRLDSLAAALDLEGARREVEELEEKTNDPNFWNDVSGSQKVLQRTKQLKNKLENHQRLVGQWEDLTTLVEMAMEEDDESLLPEVSEGFSRLEGALEEANLATLLTGEYDNSNAILSLHPGAGGTEAQDWCQMLYRMYTRWAERHNFTVKTLNYEDDDEAGIKSAAISIEGENAYGFLRSENGVHRMVRISPFDANARRQTSFAAVEVMPEIDDDTSVEIRQEDIEMQVYRASGAGGGSGPGSRGCCPSLWCSACLPPCWSGILWGRPSCATGTGTACPPLARSSPRMRNWTTHPPPFPRLRPAPE